MFTVLLPTEWKPLKHKSCEKLNWVLHLHSSTLNSDEPKHKLKFYSI